MIAVLIPNRGFILDATIQGMINSFKTCDISYKLYSTPDMPNPDGRNYLVDLAKKDEPTHMMFIDDDVVLTPEILRAMTNLKKEVVVCPYSVDSNGGLDFHLDGDGEIERAALGCCLIETSVFDKLEKPYFRTDKTFLRFGGQGRHPIIKDDPNKTWGGEDTYFFWLVRQAGIKIHKVNLQAKHLRIVTWGDKFNNIGNHRIREIDETDIRIGAWFHYYPPYHNAGAEHMMHTILKRYAKKYDVGVYSAKSKDSYFLDGVKVFNKPHHLSTYDILFTHLDEMPNAEQFAWEHDQPVVQVIHNDTAPMHIKKCDLAVFNTQWIYDKCAAEMNERFHCESIIVHPPVFEEDYKVDKTGTYVTIINLYKGKGPELVYSMARRMPHVNFLAVIGSYGDQIMPPADLPNVTVMKNQVDAKEIYKKTKVLLMPSTYESFGRTALEASLNGIPVIANDTPGLREALGEFGVFPPQRDADLWVRELEKVLKNYDYFSKNALGAIKQFDFDKEIDLLEEKLNCL
jgi:glycosyltransferase involved in cell wall biosynthesis